MRLWRRNWWSLSLMLIGLALIIAALMAPRRPSPAAFITLASPTSLPPTPSRTPEPIVPTRTQTPTPTLPPSASPTGQDMVAQAPSMTTATAGATDTVVPTQTATATASPTPSPTRRQFIATRTPSSATVTAPTAAPIAPTPIPYFSRFGVSGSLSDIGPALDAGLRFGTIFDWRIATWPVSLGSIDYWQTIRVSQSGLRSSAEDIAAATVANPGSVWIIGNEPDVIWQDNVTPERYASLYHAAYSTIKALDPTALVAIGSVSQSTPLRRAYLDIVLNSYQTTYGEPMPVDIWTVHAYILREQANSWGVGIPPGMGGEAGTLYEIADHGNVEIFKQQIVDFRAWMAAQGYANRPLAVTEFGVLMPEDYGFPPQVKEEFMAQTINYMLSATNGSGYAADGGRLVQWWFWYSLYDNEGGYPAGNLFDRPSGQLTHIGQVWTGYLNSP